MLFIFPAEYGNLHTHLVELGKKIQKKISQEKYLKILSIFSSYSQIWSWFSSTPGKEGKRKEETGEERKGRKKE